MQSRYCVRHWQGSPPGVPQDLAEAARWFRTAAEQGDTD
ncbi:MAG: SEL1-like repeat protein, partial [Bryobacteraceae bacterium]